MKDVDVVVINGYRFHVAMFWSRTTVQGRKLDRVRDALNNAVYHQRSD